MTNYGIKITRKSNKEIKDRKTQNKEIQNKKIQDKDTQDTILCWRIGNQAHRENTEYPDNSSRKKVQKKTSFNPTRIKYNKNNISSHTYISNEASSRRNRIIISYVFSHQFLSDEMK